MNKRKKIAALLLCLTVLLTVAACGARTEDNTAAQPQTPEDHPAMQPVADEKAAFEEPVILWEDDYAQVIQTTPVRRDEYGRFSFDLTVVCKTENSLVCRIGDAVYVDGVRLNVMQPCRLSESFDENYAFYDGAQQYMLVIGGNTEVSGTCALQMESIDGKKIEISFFAGCDSGEDGGQAELFDGLLCVQEAADA